MTVFTDTHAHLTDPLLLPNVDGVVAAAVASEVERILTVGTDLASSAESVRLAERFRSVWAAVGIHPHQAASYEPLALDALRQLAQHPKVVAIGEIGLDYLRSTASPDQQKLVFHEQLALATSLGLPVVVHNREATADVLTAITRVAPPDRLAGRQGVLHCFAEGIEVARLAIDHGFYISFAGNLTYRRAEALRQTAAAVPLEWLLAETDSPYLSPAPVRGQVNQPKNVRLVVEELARIRNESTELVASVTTANAERLFRWTCSKAEGGS